MSGRIDFFQKKNLCLYFLVIMNKTSSVRCRLKVSWVTAPENVARYLLHASTSTLAVNSERARSPVSLFYLSGTMRWYCLSSYVTLLLLSLSQTWCLLKKIPSFRWETWLSTHANSRHWWQALRSETCSGNMKNLANLGRVLIGKWGWQQC